MPSKRVVTFWLDTGAPISLLPCEHHCGCLPRLSHPGSSGAARRAQPQVSCARGGGCSPLIPAYARVTHGPPTRVAGSAAAELCPARVDEIRLAGRTQLQITRRLNAILPTWRLSRLGTGRRPFRSCRLHSTRALSTPFRRRSIGLAPGSPALGDGLATPRRPRRRRRLGRTLGVTERSHRVIAWSLDRIRVCDVARRVAGRSPQPVPGTSRSHVARRHSPSAWHGPDPAVVPTSVDCPRRTSRSTPLASGSSVASRGLSDHEPRGDATGERKARRPAL